MICYLINFSKVQNKPIFNTYKLAQDTYIGMIENSYCNKLKNFNRLVKLKWIVRIKKVASLAVHEFIERVSVKQVWKVVPKKSN